MYKDEHQEFIITSIEKQKRSKSRYNIFVNDEYAFSVHEDIMIKHRLMKGEIIHPEHTQTILEDEERNKAYLKALGMIGRRPHSAVEIKRKLKESGFEEVIITWACERLQEQNYVNDEQFAKMWSEHRIYSQKKGRNWVKQELQQKGVQKEIVQEAIQAIDPEEEYHGAYKLGHNKWKLTSGSLLDKKRKTAAFLLRRGYTHSIVNKVLSEVGGNVEDNDGFEVWEDES
ncbi:regulatory protein RecX [Paenibacillus hexagrammi]|uniref:Regulatory protein RecX n=1 Tax=Paenibacillus hexagrammi TaxID=2908839 RepID=A0ABY3SMZ2_9BACL|nr:RecX family transcriptional regulator [Paenibacillus sp. YPD9-1]UJF35408.1 RecX family transcriptional regulator [Paenibacillus sp. YPD9-1]